jgi:very-short-patch-repair endonuclease
MRRKLAHADRLIAEIAARQHGVISLEQLLWAGLSPDAIRHRVRVGRLHRIHRGVYAVGRADLDRHGRWKAATLALGAGAVLSHRSAAQLWDLLPPRGQIIEITVPKRTGRASREGIRVHRSTYLTDAVTTYRDGIPVTKPMRTLEDLRRAAEPAELRDAIRAAEVAGLPIGDYSHLVHRTRSELELMFLELVQRHGLPEPEVNVRVGRFLVDFLWREQRLIVETDGERFHRGALATEKDLLRDARLRALGFEILRLSHRQIVDEPSRTIASVQAKL